MCVCVCVKLPLRNLNPDLCFPHSTSTYTYRVTNVLRMCSGKCGGFES